MLGTFTKHTNKKTAHQSTVFYQNGIKYYH